ncbi:hypothetical protein FCR2A7T_19860 [Flavobacterium cauense R2A-7]|nr:hypothetical protein FCR2A7T_19860 [Flavobacterium cauense R2A-7]
MFYFLSVTKELLYVTRVVFFVLSSPDSSGILFSVAEALEVTGKR